MAKRLWQKFIKMPTSIIPFVYKGFMRYFIRNKNFYLPFKERDAKIVKINTCIENYPNILLNLGHFLVTPHINPIK